MFEPTDGSDAHARPGAELLARAGLSRMPRAVIAGCVAVIALVVAVVGWRLGGAAAGGEFVFEDSGGHTESPAEPATEHEASETDQPPVWVHVAGAVARPGLYELPPGSRVGDAVAAAGGPSEGAQLDAVNLARQLADGEQVFVPDASAQTASGPGSIPVGAAEGPAGAGGIDINRASAAELEALPGVGPATAQKIVADRETNGPFTSAEDLMRVSGIGEKKFEAMREMVVVR